MKNEAHAKLGASSSDIWLNCPGAVALWEIAPEEPESPYALEGTKAHKLLDIWLKHYRSKNGAFVFPKGYAPGMVKAVRVCVDDLKKSWNRQSKKELALDKKVSLENVVAPGMFGTLDIGVAEDFGTLEITDYKHGAGVKVDVIKTGPAGIKSLNTQLVYYALGFAAEFNFHFQNVKLKIVQPRCGQGSPISEITVQMSEVMGYIDLFKRGVERTTKKDARRVAGPWCRFCKAKKPRGDFKGCKEGLAGYRFDCRDDF